MKKIITFLSVLLCTLGFAQKVQEIKVEPVTIQLGMMQCNKIATHNVKLQQLESTITTLLMNGIL